MKVSPVNINGNYFVPNFKANSNVKKVNSEANDNAPKFHTVKDNIALFPKPLTKKEKAAQVLAGRVNKMAEEQLSEETRKKYEKEVEIMKKSIVDTCIAFDDYKDKGFNYDRAMEVFETWHDYASENNERLSRLMNAPYEMAQEERVSIASYTESNPNDLRNEIIESPLYKMYKLTKLNKQTRTHFHD